MLYFGDPHLKPHAFFYAEEGPIGEMCFHCNEKITREDSGFLQEGNAFLPRVVYHRACFIRSIIGSLAHQQKRCSCFVPGSTCGDPGDMSAREAAEAAVKYFEDHLQGE